MKEIENTRRALAGDRAALDLIWRSHRRWIAAILLVHRPRGVELEDLLQDVAVKLVEKIGELREPAALRPWLRSVALNAAREAARREKLRSPRTETSGVQDGANFDLPDPTSDQVLVTEDARSDLELVMRELGSLPPEYAEPLMLRSLSGFSQRRIAELFGVPVTTVETRLARARRMLRERLSRRRAGTLPTGLSTILPESIPPQEESH